MGEILKHVLGGHHQLASDGLLLMLVGGVGVYLRAIPEKLWAWVVDQCTMQMTVKDEDAAFVWVKEWFLEQNFLSRMRRVDLDTTLRDEQPALVPAQGRHWFWHAGRPFVVYLYRTDEKRRYSERRTEWLTFVTVGRRQEFVKEFVQAIVKCHQRRIALVSSLYVREDDYWSRVQSYMPRMLDSVILPAGEKERLVQDIERFKASKNRYRQLGVPYHRGYLLYGPPGTGKTSLVSALGAKFGMSVYVLNLTEFNDKTLMRASNDVLPNSIILFEDIDCMKSSSARPGLQESATARAINGTDGKPDNPPQMGVTLSGLLNVLDGFHAPEDVLFVMTTNVIDALDRALLRPGRIDYRMFLGRACEAQKIELYLRFFPTANREEAKEFVEVHYTAETMAEFQGLLLGLEEGKQNHSNEPILLKL
jgi:mitochondrial chaperone BCS1